MRSVGTRGNRDRAPLPDVAARGGRWRGYAGALAARHNRRPARARRPRLRAARPGCTHRTAPQPVWALCPWPEGTPGPCAGGGRVRLTPAPPAPCPGTTPDLVVLQLWGSRPHDRVRMSQQAPWRTGLEWSPRPPKALRLQAQLAGRAPPSGRPSVTRWPLGWCSSGTARPRQ